MRIFSKKSTPIISIFSLSFILVVFFTFFNLHLGLTTRFVDENSHLNLSRMVWDSLTPGISQIGFWPPLLHILMVPFTFSDFLFKSGIAGSIVSTLCFLVACLFLYKLFTRFISNRWLSAFGTLLFSLNPYILYYSTVPMMELLFLCNLFGTTYFLFRWLETESLRYLTATAFFVFITSISRFEGLILVPLVGLILLVDLLRKKRGYSEIEATGILYAMLASLGVVFILSYGWIFGDNPFAFANSQWSAFSQQRDYFLPTEHQVFVSFQYLLHAAYYMIGKWQVLIAGIGIIPVLLLVPSFETLAVLLLLASPFLFDWLALFRGNIILYVSDLPPYNVFFNERYGLYLIGLVVFIPVVFFGFVLAKYKDFRFFKTLYCIVVLSFSAAILINISFLSRTVWRDRLHIIVEGSQGYPSEDQKDIAFALSDNYDGGKILITRALHDFVTVNAGIPLRNYIQEANFQFYDQALEKPWIFSRWIVMYNPNGDATLDWSKRNEKVSFIWGGSRELDRYYTLIRSNKREMLLKINEVAVKDYALEHHMDPSKIPSINSSIETWSPGTIYEQMKKD